MHSGVAFRGKGETAYDELLIEDALDFEPVAGSTGDVFRVGSFGDDAFGVEFTGFAEDLVAVGLEVLAKAKIVA
jgi:hypothetical protein